MTKYLQNVRVSNSDISKIEQSGFLENYVATYKGVILKNYP